MQEIISRHCNSTRRDQVADVVLQAGTDQWVTLLQLAEQGQLAQLEELIRGFMEENASQDEWKDVTNTVVAFLNTPSQDEAEFPTLLESTDQRPKLFQTHGQSKVSQAKPMTPVIFHVTK